MKNAAQAETVITISTRLPTRAKLKVLLPEGKKAILLISTRSTTVLTDLRMNLRYLTLPVKLEIIAVLVKSQPGDFHMRFDSNPQIKLQNITYLLP